MNTYKPTFVYLLNGSIGDFLMVLIMLDAVWCAQPIDTKPALYILTPRNRELFEELARKYPHIKIRDYSLTSLARFLWMRAGIVITPPTPGALPLHQKVFGWLVSRMPGSKLCGFDDGKAINRLLYTTLVPYRVADTLFIELLYSLLDTLHIPYAKRQLELQIPEGTSPARGQYFVFHPFGSSDGRSLVREKLESVLRSLVELHPNHSVYVTGSTQDAEKARAAAARVGSDRIVVVAGAYAIGVVAQLIKGCDAFIGVDTGITHLANILQKKCLVIAENGTPHWLPYYNPHATIVYQIAGDESGVHEGREHLESKRDARVRYLDRVPLSVIEEHIRAL